MTRARSLFSCCPLPPIADFTLRLLKSEKCHERTTCTAANHALLGDLGGLHRSGQPDSEGRSPTGLALDCDVPAHHLTEPLANHEAKPGATVFAGGGSVRLRELLKELADLLCCHADAGVHYGDADPLRVLSVARLNGDGAALGKLMLIKLSKAWRRRIWSACSVPIAASQRAVILLVFLAASGSTVLTTLSIRGARAKSFEPWTHSRWWSARAAARRYAEPVLPRSRPLLWKLKPGVLDRTK